jgi:[pyruvate, water dikinase]-phosphate phosphotransferase / [pyruvate, water dikinase] kinase
LSWKADACEGAPAVKHCGLSAPAAKVCQAVSRRTVFFVSDQTGVTAEVLGHSLMTQFEGLEFRAVTLPFVSDLDKAHEVVRRINRTGEEAELRPIVFSTLVQDELRDVVLGANALFLDLFSAFVGPLERELNTRSTHRAGRAHGIADLATYTTRINATNFALANDDGTGGDYAHADVVLIGVSRVGKTPTCVYLALQYGVFAANYPLTEEDLEATRLPARLEAFRGKLYALTIRAERLQQIRHERRPESRYASRAQVQYELRTAEALFARYAIPCLDTTECSIEEIASRILNTTGIERRLRP